MTGTTTPTTKAAVLREVAAYIAAPHDIGSDGDRMQLAGVPDYLRGLAANLDVGGEGPPVAETAGPEPAPVICGDCNHPRSDHPASPHEGICRDRDGGSWLCDCPLIQSEVAPVNEPAVAPEENMRALGGDPDRMVDPRDHEAAIAAMRQAMTSNVRFDSHDTLVRAITVAERHMLRMAQASLGAAPEVREVPAGEAREGDTVLLPATVTEVRGGYVHAAYGDNGALVIEADAPGLTVSRPVSPLPDQPGAVAPHDVIPMEEVGALRTRTTALLAEMEVRHAATTRLYEELERLSKVCDRQRAEIHGLRMAAPAGAGVDEGGKP
jgi:hypothetical protein